MIVNASRAYTENVVVDIDPIKIVQQLHTEFLDSLLHKTATQLGFDRLTIRDGVIYGVDNYHNDVILTEKRAATESEISTHRSFLNIISHLVEQRIQDSKYL